MRLYQRGRVNGGSRWVTNDWGRAHSGPKDSPRARWPRWLALGLVLLVLPLILGAKGCSESDQCRALREAAETVCKAAPDSASCASLRQQLESCDVPTPPPTPKPDPTPPVNCLTHPDCPAGQHCEQGVGCVPDPPVECRPGEIPVIVDGEVKRCDPAPAEGCSIDGEPGAILPGYAHALGAEVNAAMSALRPDCPVGGRCVLTESRLEWQALVIAELRRRGICAGQHAPTTDEIAVAVSSVGVREGWHVYAEGLNVSGTIVWAPQAARPVYAAPSSAPTPPATPPGESCPAEPCPLRAWTAETLPPGWGQDAIGTPAWKLKCKPQGKARKPSGEMAPVADCTPVTDRQEPYCRAIGLSPDGNGVPKAACPMRPDGHPERSAVEAWVTGGTKLEGPGCEFVEGKPFTFFQGGNAPCRLCSVASPTTCSDWF